MRVINQRVEGIPHGSVYVGRPGKWGNPFPVQKGRTRAESIALHREWLLKQKDLLSQIHQLKGRDLVCWCAPLPCHAETLMELANPGWRRDQVPF